LNAPATEQQHIEVPFRVAGRLAAVGGMHKAVAGARNRRLMAGWLITAGYLGPDGGLIPTVDRDQQTFDAAKELGRIDWDHYMAKGLWNDTHKPPKVGRPLTVEFHDGTTALSKAHGGIVGFWTVGELWDRSNPDSWKGAGHTPTPVELDRADHFWSVAQMFKAAGAGRTLGLSADGLMALSKCRKRILWAKVNEAAVAELAKNPDATVEPVVLDDAVLASMTKAVDGTDLSPLALVRPGMIDGIGCDGACEACGRDCESRSTLRLTKATAETIAPTVPEDLEGGGEKPTEKLAGAEDRDPEEIEALTQGLMEKFQVSRATARRWLADYLASETPRSA